MTSKFYSKSPINLPREEFQREEPISPQRQTLPSKIVIDNSLEASQPLFPVISASSHPIIALLHIILKIATVVVYIIFPMFSDSFLVKEIVVIIAGIDFWIVKNITGRLLVGLRWWVDFDHNGD